MKILFPSHLYQRMRAYVVTLKYEISGLGKIKILPSGDLLIEDLVLLEQTVGPGYTTIDKDGMAKFYDRLVKEGEDMSTWKLWWHSHAMMETFWSQTDTNTIEDFNNEMDADNWTLSLETNHEGKILTRLDVFRPLRITLDDIPWDIIFENKEIEDQAFRDVVEKVNIFSQRRSNKKTNGNSNHSLYLVGNDKEKIKELFSGSPPRKTNSIDAYDSGEILASDKDGPTEIYADRE
jgi:hypothetical protein